jgi:nodulation protein E
MTSRVAVTGLGALSAVGNDVAAHHAAILSGTVGIRLADPDRANERSGSPCAEVKGFVPEDHFTPKSLAIMDRASQLAVVAAREAIVQAGDAIDPGAPMRAGVLFGAALGYGTIEESYRKMYGEGVARVHPFVVPKAMPSAPASQICMDLGIRGPSLNVASACASATHAMGLAFQMIRSGLLDVAVAGGCEAPLTLGFMRSWDSLRVVAKDTCRPFSRDRSGLVLGEGAGVLVLENWDRAEARGARIHAEIVGFGLSSDAGDITASDPVGAARAMTAAIADAGLSDGAIDYVQAHGTGTVLNDRNEVQALRHVLGSRLVDVPVSSSKSMLGHTLGASGGLAMVFTILALREGLLPPTMNCTEPDPELDLDCVPNAARRQPIRIAMTNAFAFGGLNAVLVSRSTAG